MSCTHCQQVFQERLQETVTSHLGGMQHEHHTRALLGGRAAHCSPRDHQQDVPVDNFAIQEVQRAQLLLGVPTSTQRAPSPLLHTGCRAKPPSEQGNQHRPSRALLVTFCLQFLIAALDPRFLNFLKLQSHTQACGYSKKGHPKPLPGVMSLQHLTLHVQVT